MFFINECLGVIIYENKYSNWFLVYSYFHWCFIKYTFKVRYQFLNSRKQTKIKFKKPWFCQIIHNFIKSRQKVSMKLVYIAEDILVFLTLKSKNFFLNKQWLASTCSFLIGFYPVALKKKNNTSSALYHMKQHCRIWFEIALNHTTRNLII